ncbi:impact family protein [Metarhizium album ARSEF 1941]|uniref:Impact family protein n=1 Tax=Metarhizium album (strain ARSEF 1941) TaxID=1081103 RepID=A0A0B2X3K1_METAS|nr:impact family protein [Metarhizium album ARSEF 1941]KHO00303.1 impact family protein [Metarhizium album ARSEF 1941]
MSDELVDEAEAINAIYGDGSLVRTEDECASTYVLKLPGGASWLRIQFPEAYPAQPPAVLGTHHSSGGVRGAGARDVRLFREALSSVFHEGSECLFDAVEEFGRRAGERVPASEGREEEEEEDRTPGRPGDDVDAERFPAPEWTLSEAVVENKSTFVARVARASSPGEARSHVARLLAADKKVRLATHNVTAWRMRGGRGEQFQDCDDDGETAAGGRLLHLMRVMDVWGAVVVVSRWYGGVKLGPRRFSVINGVARDGMVRAGVAGR